MISTDPRLDDMRKRAIARLLARRKQLQQAADELATAPASYGITGSVNVTNQKTADLKQEIAEIDLQIKALLTGTSSSVNLTYPDYRIKWPL